MALIPIKRKFKELKEIEKNKNPEHKVLEGSHDLYCDCLAYRKGDLYVLNPYLKHRPEVHPDIKGEGWFKLVVGQRSNFYDFAAPTVD